MKFTALILGLLMSISLVAQDFQGVITYKISYEDLPDEMKPYESMLPKESKLLYRDKMSKSITNNPMTGGETIVLTDNEKGEALVLMDLMGQKYAISSKDEGEDAEEKPEVNYEDTGEEKEIAGYKCKIATAEMEESTLRVCYTNKLPAINVENVKGLDGFPLEIIIESPQVTRIQTVVDITEGKVEKIALEAPDGYTKMSQKEFQEQMGGMAK